MNIKEYIELDRGNSAALARAVGVAAPTVSQWAAGTKKPSIENCKRIEFATAGAVTCGELRPEVNWQYVRGLQSESASTAAHQ